MVADEWLSLQQIAEELDLPLRTLYAQRSKGEGPPGYRIGKHVRVRRSDLNTWLDRQADQPTRLGAAGRTPAPRWERAPW